MGGTARRMKHFLLNLLKRPSTWVGVLSAALLIVVLTTPGPDRVDAVSAKRSSPLPVGVLEPLEETPVVERETPTAELAHEKRMADQVPAKLEPEMSVPKAVAIQPIQGPPAPSTLRLMEEAWLASFHGVPDKEKVETLLRERIQGPPDLADLTISLLSALAGPPSPAETGPPIFAMVEGADKVSAAEQKEAVEMDPKLAEGKSTLQKPTTRITPPPAPPVPPTPPEPVPEVAMKKEPEPEPPPLNEEELPPAQGDVWKVVKVQGRDYVTGQSMQLFYRFNTHKVEGKHVWFRNPNLIIKGQVGSQELLVNNIKFILSYPVLYQGGQALFSRLDLCKLIEPVIRPSYIGSSSIFDTVVLDAGHGGHDSGAKGVYGYEKNYALAMVFAVRDALIKRGFKVILTRSNDTFLSLTSRVAVANKTPNSIFISIHFNSGGSAASGIETFALTPQGSASSVARGGGFSNTARVGNQFDSENIALATAVHAQVVHRFKLVDRGIKRARWTVLTGCTRPGILFEGGFVTNSRECQLIASDQYRKALSEAIGDAVTNYRRALAPRAAGR